MKLIPAAASAHLFYRPALPKRRLPTASNRLQGVAQMSGRPNKKPRLLDNDPANPSNIRSQREAFLSSLGRGISPPPQSRNALDTSNCERNPASISPEIVASENHSAGAAGTISLPSVSHKPQSRNSADRDGPHTESVRPRIVSSPFKLTAIRDLPPSANVDTVTLHDILGNPLIKEAWVFNFCFDVDWMMQFFDSDVRQMVQVKIIHGSWRTEDSNRIAIDDACSRWPNVQASRAYLPDPFGTHHSKMFILFCHDETVEIVIHTANMLAKDWTNMTQAVWRSGPLQRGKTTSQETGPIGSGSRFKSDLLAYLAAYSKSCKALHESLSHYDFSSVRGALVASVPTKISFEERSTKDVRLWGHPMLREVVSSIKRPAKRASTAHLAMQVSSIATLPAGWLKGLVQQSGLLSDSFSVIYPTAEDVRISLDGYAAGGSIHTKAQSSLHLKQIDSLRPHLQRWTNSTTDNNLSSGRGRAAPHIKTYIKYSVKPTVEKLRQGEVEIEWALLTSANLSTQAWGTLPKTAKGAKTKKSDADIVHIQSFEIGVLVWPELFLDEVDPGLASDREEAGHPRKARMVPSFASDKPDVGRILGDEVEVVVGLRMPYDLPLTPYRQAELPWSPANTYNTPDSQGMAWTPKGR